MNRRRGSGELRKGHEKMTMCNPNMHEKSSRNICETCQKKKHAGNQQDKNVGNHERRNDMRVFALLVFFSTFLSMFFMQPKFVGDLTGGFCMRQRRRKAP